MPNEGAETIAVPGFQTGESLGAIISKAQAAGDQIINYYFPIEVEVLGRASDAEMEHIARYVYNVLSRALRNRD